MFVVVSPANILSTETNLFPTFLALPPTVREYESKLTLGGIRTNGPNYTQGSECESMIW